MSGNITVVTASGDVNLSSVDGTSRFGREEYVQIGHGGLYTGGDHTGNISVIAQDGQCRPQGRSRQSMTAATIPTPRSVTGDPGRAAP
ncbi:MAG: hypothetical protein R3F31_25685 [Verrucomicrobiales bacterium]